MMCSSKFAAWATAARTFLMGISEYFWSRVLSPMMRDSSCYSPMFLLPSAWFLIPPFYPERIGRDFNRARVLHVQIHPWLPHLWLGPPWSTPGLGPELPVECSIISSPLPGEAGYCLHKYLASTMQTWVQLVLWSLSPLTIPVSFHS